MIHLENGVFQAKIVPETGGNVISLVHLASGTKLLREPADFAELRKFPEQFGLPVLFPPNRIADGRFVFEGKTYQLPVNETRHHNHLHGLVVGRPWEVSAFDAHSAELRFSFIPDFPEYAGFPFRFTLLRKVCLTQSGLTDEMTVANPGDSNMPLGLGYHSTFPSIGARIRLSTAAHQIGIGDRFLPDGKYLPWEEYDPREFFDPNGRNVGFHAEAETNNGLHGAEIRYPAGLLRYRTDEKFRFWYTWNRRGEGDFISLEPVSWMANALNEPGDPEKTGVRTLGPGCAVSFRSELQFIPL